MIKVLHAALHAFDLDTGECQLSERELDVAEQPARSYTQRMLRRAVQSPENRQGTFEGTNVLLDEIRRYLQGERGFLDLSCDIARTLWEQLRTSEDATPRDLLVADFTDTEAGSTKDAAVGEAETDGDSAPSPDGPPFAVAATDGVADTEDRTRRLFGIVLLPRKKAYMHETTAIGGVQTNDLLVTDAVIPGPTQKITMYAVVDAAAGTVVFQDAGVTIAGREAHIIEDALLKCEATASPREVVDTVVRIAGEIAEEHGRSAAVAMADAKDYVSHSVQQEEHLTPAEVGTHVFPEEPELAERFEDAVTAERLPEEVEMRPSVARRLAKSHRIRTDTGIDITFPSAYAADQHFIEFDREADGGIVIRIHAASIENR